MSTIKIATLNINGITARTRVLMLADFIRRHDFDIIFTQEVTSTEVMNVRGYNAHLNIGFSIRGTAILATSTLHLTNITTLPSGRAIAADCKGIRLMDVYAPSGTARRANREQFYTTELPYLFHEGPIDLLIRGDFNCVLHPSDTTGHFQPSRALSEIRTTRCLETEPRPTYIYILLPPWSHETRPFIHNLGNTAKKIGIEFMPVAFTDQYAVAIRITVQHSNLQKARVRWKMDPILINDKHLIKRISSEWVKWQTHKRHCPDITMWWERYVKNAFLSSSAKNSTNLTKNIR